MKRIEVIYFNINRNSADGRYPQASLNTNDGNFPELGHLTEHYQDKAKVGILVHAILFRFWNGGLKIAYTVSHINGNTYDVSRDNLCDEPLKANKRRAQCHQNLNLVSASCPHGILKCQPKPADKNTSFFEFPCLHPNCLEGQLSYCLHRRSLKKWNCYTVSQYKKIQDDLLAHEPANAESTALNERLFRIATE